MFFHNFKYELLRSIRVKDVIIWLMMFPIVLGFFFKIAFSDIYEKSDVFSTVPVAVVENKKNEIFRSVIEEIENSDAPLLKVTYTDEKNALKLLKTGDAKGIIYVGDELSLTVSEKGIEQTILKSFIEQYSVQESIITDTIKNEPAKLTDVMSALNAEIAPNEEILLTEGNTDPYVAYFYNLIAMVAMFGTLTGLHVSVGNQGNLSPLGARKCCSPTPKYITIMACLLGSFVIQSLCIIICVTYLEFVLKIDFGSNLPYVYLAGILGGMLGVALGFMIGSIGRMSFNIKTGICMTVSMLSCFLSGLMIGDMKAVIAEKLPWFNNINPAALISDSFYCLNIYSDYERYMQKIISMLIITAVFIVIGMLLTRRRKYASL